MEEGLTMNFMLKHEHSDQLYNHCARCGEWWVNNSERIQSCPKCHTRNVTYYRPPCCIFAAMKLDIEGVDIMRTFEAKIGELENFLVSKDLQIAEANRRTNRYMGFGENWAERMSRKLRKVLAEMNLPKNWKPFRYLECCCESSCSHIWDLQESSKSVTYRTMLKHCDLELFADVFGYEVRGPNSLKNDWHIDYCKGVYKGLPCYYLVHSGIEYIWVKKP
jgi:hypothetical protein